MSPRCSIVVLTGAGVSADSGVATFRGGGGLWEGRRVEDVATPAAWAVDPRGVWRFYQLRRAQLLEVEPNPAHHALAEFERVARNRGHDFLLVSQNVDDLHQRAGSSVLSMHGQLLRLLCESCGAVTEDQVRLDPDEFARCERCSTALHPDVVWFGEYPAHLDEIFAALASATHFVAIGTSGAVYPAAGFLAQARSNGARTYIQALEEPENREAFDEFLPGRAADVVPQACARWAREWFSA